MVRVLLVVLAVGAAAVASAQDPCSLVYLDAQGTPQPTLDVSSPLGTLHVSDPALVRDGTADQAEVRIADGSGVSAFSTTETSDTGVFEFALSDVCSTRRGVLTCTGTPNVTGASGTILSVSAATTDCDAAGVCRTASSACRIDLDLVDSRRDYNPMRIKVPRDFRTIQAAIDAAPDGARILIAAGEYRENLMVSGDRELRLVGVGAVASGFMRTTTLLGDSPRVVGDIGVGSSLLTVERGASVRVRGILFDGGDTAIHLKDSAEDARVSDVAIQNSARGIVVSSIGKVKLLNSTITGTLWHGVIVNAFAPPSKLEISGLLVTDTAGVGFYLNHVGGTCDQSGDHMLQGNLATGNALGGIYILDSGACVFNNFVAANGRFGVAVLTSPNAPPSVAWLSGNSVTLNYSVDGEWGDGLLFWGSNVRVEEPNLFANGRSGLTNVGSHVEMGNTNISCNPIDMIVDSLGSTPGTFNDLGGNLCGCPAGNACVASSVDVAPPDPIDP